MKISTLFFLFIICSNANAQTPNFDSGSSPFEVLENFYNSSTQPATFADFDLNTVENSNQHCVMARASDTSPEAVYAIHAIIPVSAATPPQGPLFPGTPGQISEVLLLSSSNDFSSDDLVKSYNNQTVTFTSTDLILNFKQQVGRGGYPADGPILFQIRKNNNLIAFKAQNKVGDPTGVTLFGYCFRQ